jgi:hypothetical protein
MAAPNAGAPPVTPGDTRLKDALLRAEKEQRRRDALSEAARAAEEEAEAIRAGVTHVSLDEGFTPLPEAPENSNPQSGTVIVRFRREVDEMAYGRSVITPPVYDRETGSIARPAVLGNIRYFTFKEGRRYEIPREMAEHLLARGIVYDYQ